MTFQCIREHCRRDAPREMAWRSGECHESGHSLWLSVLGYGLAGPVIWGQGGGRGWVGSVCINIPERGREAGEEE